MKRFANDDAIDRDQEAAIWCINLAEGELTRDERNAFDRWIADPANAAAFQGTAALWGVAEAVSGVPEVIHMRRAALEDYGRNNARRWQPRTISRYRTAALAATAMAMMVAVGVSFYDPAQVYRTGVGERRIAMLDDGSRLSLDADSEVDVRLGRNRRELTLIRGRAKFDVAKDALKPFSVAAGDKMVVATGTAFSVETIGHEMHVVLYEGHVTVLDKRADAPSPVKMAGTGGIAADTALTPGRELTAETGAGSRATVVATDMPRSLSWEAGELVFDDEPLPSAVERMNRYAREPMVIGNAGAAQVRVNGVFTSGDIAAFTEALTRMSGVHVDRDQGRLVLRRD